MPRYKTPYPTIKVLITLPTALQEAMNNSLFDSERGRVPGGAVSKYIQALIKRDLERVKGLSFDDLKGDLE